MAPDPIIDGLVDRLCNIAETKTLQEAQRQCDAAGPKPLTIEEYKRRNNNTASKPKEKKKRGGKRNKLNKELELLKKLSACEKDNKNKYEELRRRKQAEINKMKKKK